MRNTQVAICGSRREVPFSPGSPGVLQAGGNAGDGAEDEVDESGLLALRVLLQFFLSRVRPIVSFDSTTNVLHQAQIMW